MDDRLSKLPQVRELAEIARAVVAASDVTKAAREAFLEHPTTKLPPIGGGNGPAEA